MEMCFICIKNPATSENDYSHLLCHILKMPEDIREKFDTDVNRLQRFCSSCKETLDSIHNDIVEMEKRRKNIEANIASIDKMLIGDTPVNVIGNEIRNQIVSLKWGEECFERTRADFVFGKVDLKRKKDEKLYEPRSTTDVQNMNLITSDGEITSASSDHGLDKSEHISPIGIGPISVATVAAAPLQPSAENQSFAAVADSDSDSDSDDNDESLKLDLDLEDDVLDTEIKIEPQDEWDLNFDGYQASSENNWEDTEQENDVEDQGDPPSVEATHETTVDGSVPVSAYPMPIQIKVEHMESSATSSSQNEIEVSAGADLYECGESGKKFKKFAQLEKHEERLRKTGNLRREPGKGRLRYELRSEVKPSKKNLKRCKKR